jgi:hypothetical protein
MTTTVPKALRDLGKLYEERNKKYGDNYKLHGAVMRGLFPDGVELRTSDDFNRYSCVKEIATRLGRYSFNFHNGGHADSLNDISVYAQMLQELDNET